MKLELLAPAGSMACLKAAVSKNTDAVYLGMRNFNARNYATNFDKNNIAEAVKICKSNNVKIYLTMNTLIKNNELKQFFDQLSFAYSKGIDAVILQEISLINLIKNNFPDLRIHISTQAGVMNSFHANLLSKVDRVTLARELTENNIKDIRKNFNKEIEIFCHGALCTSVSGQCLFSSFLGGRSGNRGKCAQPCRKKYNNEYLLSTKELCLINEIPEIIKLGINSIKIEGRMRSPYYVATVTDAYRKAIDSYYNGNFKVENLAKLKKAFSREFTKGWFKQSKDIFNVTESNAMTRTSNEFYNVKAKKINIKRKIINVKIPSFKEEKSDKELLVRVYNKEDAIEASKAGADIVCMDLKDFENIKLPCKLFTATPRIMLDSDVNEILKNIKEKNPDGIIAGNMGMLNLNLKIPIYLDYNLNVFNDADIDYFKKNIPIISPELSLKDLNNLNNKNFFVLVHGKIRLMTLRHDIQVGEIKDEKGSFKVNKIYNGTEIINKKEIGLLSKSSQLLSKGVNKFYVDTDVNVSKIVKFYRDVLDGKKVNDIKLKKKYVLGWAYKGVI